MAENIRSRSKLVNSNSADTILVARESVARAFQLKNTGSVYQLKNNLPRLLLKPPGSSKQTTRFPRRYLEAAGNAYSVGAYDEKSSEIEEGLTAVRLFNRTDTAYGLVLAAQVQLEERLIAEASPEGELSATAIGRIFNFSPNTVVSWRRGSPKEFEDLYARTTSKEGLLIPSVALRSFYEWELTPLTVPE